MIQIVVDPNYHGPTIFDWGLDPTVEDKFVEIRWTNTKQEITRLEHLSHCNFRLFVADTIAQERTANAVGVFVQLDKNMVNTARVALNARKAYDWRNFSDGKPVAVTRNVITKLSADAIRRGKTPALAALAGDFARDGGINPIDADVLLRLKVLGE